MQNVQTVDELQKILEERIQKLDEDRRRDAELLAKERAEILELAASERNKQLEANRAAEERARHRKVAEQEAEQERIRKTREEQLLLEQKQNAADELVSQQRAKLEWLENEIAKVEFIEEQHQKAMESARSVLQPPPVTDETVVTKPGDAVSGTEGSTPETPLMSQHLKSILRQAQRTY